MNTLTPSRLVLCILLLCCGTGVGGQDEERPIWEQEVMLVYSDRSTEFNRLRSIGKENKRLSLYTTALDTLHGKVPVEEGEKPYQVAQRIFRLIIADNDSDAIGLASAYYNARITQSNPYEQDIAEAKKLYWKLYERWPQRFFGQMAFVKYATLHIYDDDGSGDGVWQRIQNLEPIVSDISIPELRQNVHRIMGEAYFGFELDSQLAYEHMVEAYRLGIPVGSIRIEVLERIASLGEEIGEYERALLAYDELVRSAPRHERFVEFVEAAQRLRKQVAQPTAE
ncbi:hypothetical protein QEH56_08240 [Pelagicoccus enzymogenes]|uniref:hypothetical protein n=1 Tax=Pelagicoccus enzymogenes TaxID=2773457 RepID=UPI00280E1060|nr:hypothetical protein [Pelagicoccus enzymogenes]MDQ8198132.1 hypothetical protein [Pelagicoccus enzymogenes]